MPLVLVLWRRDREQLPLWAAKRAKKRNAETSRGQRRKIPGRPKALAGLVIEEQSIQEAALLRVIHDAVL